MITVSYILNRYIAPFTMGLSMAAFSVSSDPVALVILFAIAMVAGAFSLPNGERMIERCFDALI
jgi:hypothetical protein